MTNSHQPDQEPTAPDDAPVPGGSSGGAKSLTTSLLIAGLLAVAGVLFINNVLNRPKIGGLGVGETAPEIRAAGWVNGAPAEPLAGKVVVVDAWATWCGPCRKKAPELVETWKKYRDRGVQFIGLTAEEADSLPMIEEFVSEVGIEWPNGFGASQTLLEFQAEYIPSVWVIGTDGKIVWNHDSRGTLEDGIEKALAAAR